MTRTRRLIILAIIIAWATRAADGSPVANEHEERLWRAVCQVESGGRVNAIGDGGNAVGIAQIWKVCVDDVNRIIGRTEYTYDDRLSAARSKEMFLIYTRHYCRAAGGWTAERAARIWNGGPRGYQKTATAGYWQKVERAMSNG